MGILMTKDRCLHHVFEDQVEKTPNAVAVICGSQQISYAELNSQANQFARLLQSKGVRGETPVGIFLERSIEMVIAIWGIFKAGGTYVPLDIALPLPRLNYILQDTQMPLVITDDQFVDRLPEGVLFLSWTRERSILDQLSAVPLEDELDGENLAYVAYTSGSTGNPKGVMIPHRVFTRCAYWGEEYFHFTSKDRFLLNFFRAPEELLFPLFTGATVVLSPRDAERDTALLLKTIHENEITVVGLTPTLLNQFLNEPQLEDCESLRHLFCAGEGLPVVVQQRFFERLPAAQLYNFYGLAEAPFTSIWRCVAGDGRPVVPVGQPVDAIIKILDEDLEAVTGQTIGEIYIGGPGLARGYLNLPELTADRFIYLDGERYYKTGDRAFGDNDGQIIFLGRSDHQVQIRGLRVELGEVEAAFQRQSKVAEVAVSLVNDQLVAYLLMRPDESFELKEWQAILGGQLPDYMLPSSFVLLDEMPLATTGKIDRRALPLPERQIVTDLRNGSISESERNKVLFEWNATQSDYPRTKCIHSLFEEQVKESPDSIALVFGKKHLTYRELNKKANQLAHYLVRQGVKYESLVGLCFDRSIDMIVGILGILKAGAAYVPLDPSYPKDRLKLIVEDTRMSVIVSRLQAKDLFPDYNGLTVFVDFVANQISRESELNPTNDLSSLSLAYVMYTSGSTGRPKGVCVEHRSIVRLVEGVSYIDFGANEVFLQMAPLAFDASTFEIWGALLHGARLVVLKEKDPSLIEIVDAIDSNEVTILWLTSGLFNLMVDQCLDGLRSVRQLIAGGDVLSRRHVERAFRVLKGCRIVNGYGPTEGTTFSCCHEITNKDFSFPSIPIGRPISNTTAYILNEELVPVRVGEEGELFIGGDGLARGYLNQPDLTVEKFIRNPFGPGRLYRTGDSVRYFPDGNLEFLGRKDQQVKLRGFRIELGEVEQVIAEYDGVTQTVAILREDQPGDKQLVAYIVAESPIYIKELQEYLQAKLPEYMVPTAYVVVEEIPLTPNGKVDRKALKKPEFLVGTNASVSSTNRVEHLLLEIWKEVLNLNEIGVHDDFFSLGGHSLKAMQVLNLIREKFSVSIRLRTLFANPEIRKLGEVISESLSEEERKRTENDYNS